MNYDNVILRLTEEHGPSREAPASYWLGRWRNHTAAEAAIEAAIDRKWGEFETPQGLMLVRRVG